MEPRGLSIEAKPITVGRIGKVGGVSRVGKKGDKYVLKGKFSVNKDAFNNSNQYERK